MVDIPDLGMYKLTPEGLLHQATSTEQSLKFWIDS